MLATVAEAIQHKAGLPADADPRGFLQDYHAALCMRLERGQMIGQRHADKHERAISR